MNIKIEGITCIHSDEEYADNGAANIHHDDESLFIDVKSGDKYFSIILDKEKLNVFRNALTCFIDSDLVKHVEDDED